MKSTEISQQMKEKHINKEQTLKILENYNKGKYKDIKPVIVSGIPSIDGETIIDLRADVELKIPYKSSILNLERIGADIDLNMIGIRNKEDIVFNRSELEKTGILLYPLLSYGILNGGSASSYVDEKKNKAFNTAYFKIVKSEFNKIAVLSRGKAKGITPAYINPDGTPGASFIELKMRALLIQALEYKHVSGKIDNALFPMFQMTSVYNNTEMTTVYSKYKTGPLLKDLIKITGLNITETKTGIQPLLAAFSFIENERPISIFSEANGVKGELLPLPGGHGQNFSVLKDIYKALHARGKRFVYLGNVDNIGNTADPVSLAILALTGKQAGFDFSFRTSVDVKGGILIKDNKNRLNCADIGAAISRETVFAEEEKGREILFNCATGLFNLDYLVTEIDEIIENLPIRFSNQDKDSGKYSQAEQITWEIIGMLDDFLVFGIDKYDRFIAAKLLLEGLLTSGIGLNNPDFPSDPDPSKDIKRIAENLNSGLIKKLSLNYGMKLEKNRWIPKSVSEIVAGF